MRTGSRRNRQGKMDEKGARPVQIDAVRDPTKMDRCLDGTRQHCLLPAGWTMALIGFALTMGGQTGCQKGPSVPTESAPATLTNVNIAALTAKKKPELDDQDDEDEPDDQDRPKVRPRPRWSIGAKTSPDAKAAMAPGMGPKTYHGTLAPTINGHPKGPKAEVFNRIINATFPRINSCFAARIQAMPTGRSGIQVRIVVGNNGRVKSTTVAGGIADQAVRSCVTRVLSSTVFPAYQGPEVNQVVPFTFVRPR
ncbi:MAG: AgmX/PglI C-terminal domain-containing protein [Deltaproteobacteria bacterium]|nr:AgmX/PglI C-terminal domain-containing protein [Deltaproteobacteria bacterium]